MQEQPKIISEREDPKLDLVVLALGFVALGIGLYYLAKSLDVYPQIRVLENSLLWFGIAAGLIYRYSYELEILYVYNDRIVVKTLLGRVKKVVRLEDIEAWIENQQQTLRKRKTYGEIKQFTVRFELILFSKNKKYSLKSSSYNNYGALKNEIVTGIPYGRPNEYQKNERINLPSGIILAFICFMIFFYIPRGASPGECIDKTRLTPVTGVVVSDPEILPSKGRFTLRLRLKDYPDFNFVALFPLRGVEESTVRRIDVGDTVIMDLSTDTYLKKIVKTTPLGFWDKTLDYRLISIYGLRYKGTECKPLLGSGYFYAKSN